MDILLKNPIKNEESSNILYGKKRIILAEYVSDILNTMGIDWFIESGTLLGAWRNHKLLSKDDDFDIAIVLEKSNYIDKLNELNEYFNNNLPNEYKSRIVTSYCHKLEIYQPSYGNYILPDPKYKGADFHNVTIDLQVYCKDKAYIYPLYYLYEEILKISLDDVYPISRILLEDKLYNSPNNTKAVLEAVYGYLGKDYLYNPITRKYIKDN